MTAHKARVAQEMYRSGQYTIAAIATTLGVSRASIYRHLRAAAAAAEPNVMRQWRAVPEPSARLSHR
jgi:transposase-like protein